MGRGGGKAKITNAQRKESQSFTERDRQQRGAVTTTLQLNAIKGAGGKYIWQARRFKRKGSKVGETKEECPPAGPP